MIIDDIWKNGKIAHVKPTHKFESNQGINWWVYKISLNVKNLCYSFDWIKEPDDKINLELGNKLYQIGKIIDKWHQRKHIAKTYLERAIELKIKNLQEGMCYCVIINEHDYWYRAVLQQFGNLSLKKIVWAEEGITIIK